MNKIRNKLSVSKLNWMIPIKWCFTHFVTICVASEIDILEKYIKKLCTHGSTTSWIVFFFLLSFWCTAKRDDHIIYSTFPMGMFSGGTFDAVHSAQANNNTNYELLYKQINVISLFDGRSPVASCFQWFLFLFEFLPTFYELFWTHFTI